MRPKVLLVGSLLLALCLASSSRAGLIVGIVNSLPDTPESEALSLTLLHTTKRWADGTVDPGRRVMTLTMQQTFVLNQPLQGPNLHLVLFCPAICRYPRITLQCGDKALPLTRLSEQQTKAMVGLLLRREEARGLRAEDLQLLSTPLGSPLRSGTTWALNMSCRIWGTEEDRVLLMPIPQLLHRLEPEPIGELRYQIAVGPCQSVETPGHIDFIKVEPDQPEKGWFRVTYQATKVPVEDLQDFILRIIR